MPTDQRHEALVVVVVAGGLDARAVSSGVGVLTVLEDRDGDLTAVLARRSFPRVIKVPPDIRDEWRRDNEDRTVRKRWTVTRVCIVTLHEVTISGNLDVAAPARSRQQRL